MAAGTTRRWVRRHPILAGVISLVVVMSFVGAVADTSEDTSPRAESSQGANADEPSTEPRDGDEGDERAAEPKPDPRPKPTPGTHRVVYVVDGDTLHIANGEKVRLIGIDAPDRGECGFRRARARLSRLVLGKRVVLRKAVENRDFYGRLLRYVDVNGTDAGLRLIKAGLADAKYDSRDGYGFHPRERSYIIADAENADTRCAKPVPIANPAPSKKSCAPGYSPCIPPYPPDLDCADIGHPVAVTGSDPHALDRDGDGQACEWS